MYELFYDEVPFYADSLAETYGRIMDHEVGFCVMVIAICLELNSIRRNRNILHSPRTRKLLKMLWILCDGKRVETALNSDVFGDLMRLSKRLICKKEDRLGRNGAEELKKHKWFDGFDWENARKGIV